MQEGAEGVLSRLKWRLRATAPISLDSIGIAEGRYLAVAKGGRSRMIALFRVGLAETAEESKLDYSAAIRVTLQQQRMKGLFDGLHRTKVPFLYLILVKPADEDGENQVFEFDLVVGTWVDLKSKEADEPLSTLEQNAGVLAASLSVGVPNATVRRLTRHELRGFAESFLQPAEPRLAQVADANILSRLESFESRSPMVQSAQTAADFYVPNSAESGTDGILLGRVKVRSRQAHGFRLQLEDLRRHVALLGSTGAGKSNTAAVMVRQVAGMGLPVMVLDWHIHRHF